MTDPDCDPAPGFHGEPRAVDPDADPARGSDGEPRSVDPDADLVQAVRAGDRRALEDLLGRHQARLWAVCRRLTGSEADADDATQEALVSIVRALPRFDGRSRFGTWAYRIAVNASLDELRRRRRRPDPGLPGDADVDRAEPVAATGRIAGRPDPENVALSVDVDTALRRLPPDFRAPVVLRDLCGLDYAEIAEVLGVPPGTVRSRISRGRAALAPLLAPGSERPEGTRPGTAGDTGPEQPHRIEDAKLAPPPRTDTGPASAPVGNLAAPSERPTSRP